MNSGIIYKLTTVCAAIVFSVVMAQAKPGVNEAADTLLKVDQPSRLVITENLDGSIITVTREDGDDSFQTSVKTEYPKDSSVSSKQSVLSKSQFEIPGFSSGGKKGDKGWKCYVDGICFGLNNAMGLPAENKGLQWSKSIEIGLLNVLAPGYSWGNTALSLGLGFNWRNYKITTSDRYLAATPGKGIDWMPASTLPAGSRLQNSRVKVFSLQLPLLFRTRIPGSCVGIKLGPIFNFNTYASLKTNYEDMSGNKVELFTKDISPRRFTLDFYGSVSLSNLIGIYVRYSPMKVMNASDGINFRPLTIGIGIGI